MKQLLIVIMLCCVSFGFAQEGEEEFLPITIEDKEAFMSTKTGEYVFRAHADTNPDELKTTASGVVYNDISTHKVVKGETLSSIAKKYKINLAQLKKDNKLKLNKLSLGQELKIVNRILVTSSSPVISYAGEERIIAKLRPGQSPSTIAPPPPDATPIAVSTPEKTQSPDAKKPMSRKSTYYKPMVIPNKTAQTEIEVEDDIKQESNEVIEAQRQLEEAQKKLALAKQKVLNKETEEKQELVAAAEKSEEIKQEEEKVKAKYNAIQEKLEKVKSTSDKKIEEKKESLEETIAKEKVEAKKVEEKQAPETETKEEVEGVDYHIIVKGDNLYNLAKTYKTTVKKLTELNNVKFNNLKIGQKLKLK